MKKRPFWLTVVLVVDSSNSIVLLTAMADADLQIRRGGSSRPWDKEEGGLPQKFFSVLRASFSSKNKGGGGGLPGPLPWIRH